MFMSQEFVLYPDTEIGSIRRSWFFYRRMKQYAWKSFKCCMAWVYIFMLKKQDMKPKNQVQFM